MSSFPLKLNWLPLKSRRLATEGPSPQLVMEAMKGMAPGPWSSPVTYWCSTSFHLYLESWGAKNDSNKWPLMSIHLSFLHTASHWHHLGGWAGGVIVPLCCSFFFFGPLSYNSVFAWERYMKVQFYTLLCILLVIQYKHTRGDGRKSK